MQDIIVAVILGIIEGITEFLPVSSTGHLILANEFFTFRDPVFAAMFDIVIQSGAILSVLIYFRRRLVPTGEKEHRGRVLSLWRAAIVGVIPALVLGAAFGDLIEEHLFNPFVVAGSLLVGGIAILVVERRAPRDGIAAAEDIPLKIALLIGLIQCLAMVPGVSRSAATIIGAMLLGTTRVAAAEFSFFLAIPTIGAATAYSLLKHSALVSGEQAFALAVGFVVSFLTAYAVIALFMRWVSTRTFAPFGWYRIALAIAVVAYFSF
ncbi:MAG TPA: undecaprenyl-diphosphate phosphatase [bacterium]|nr:undecaprenyl-diphosphate phosphatase [bacterium]